MTSYEIEKFAFNTRHIEANGKANRRLLNWPVVYILENPAEIYVGESLNAVTRLKQHLDSDTKARLVSAKIIVNEEFNKSVCLDLESFLIRLFAGDGRYEVLNRNDGVTNADYYDRPRYRESFDEIFEELRKDGAFTRPIREIENTDLYKLSPFKALTPDQAGAVEDILEGLFADIESGKMSRIVIQGDPGTGKTVVAVYLMKLLQDIKHPDVSEPTDGESVLSEFFTPEHTRLLTTFKIGLVVPQQSLRKTIQKVFRKTRGLSADMVMTPFEVGESADRFDLLIVDETHRLNQRASQPSGRQNAKFTAINRDLFGQDDPTTTQLDWINAKSNHQIFLLDAAQTVKPHDVPQEALSALLDQARSENRRYPLSSQMRVKAGSDYVGYIRGILSRSPPEPQVFDGYDLRMFDDLSELHQAIRDRDSEVGLARLVAGYAWDWKSKKDRSQCDIEFDGVRLRWNQTAVDWINSIGSINEVGSIHTVQGYDLNYVGVIIGLDLRFDPAEGQLRFDRENYFDKKGKENNKQRGIVYSDDDILRFVRNIYAVLLTRGVLGTYVYVCDPSLRAHFRRFFHTSDQP